MNRQVLSTILKLPEEEAEQIWHALVHEIALELLRFGSTKVMPLGTLTLRRRPARTARNPRTGEAVPLPDRRIVRFKPSPELRRKLRT